MKLLVFIIALFLYMVSCADLDWNAKFSFSLSFGIGSTPGMLTSAAMLQLAKHRNVSYHDQANRIQFEVHRNELFLYWKRGAPD